MDSSRSECPIESFHSYALTLNSDFFFQDKSLHVLVYLENGSACLIACPDPTKVDHSKTFEIIGLKPHLHYDFQSIKSRLRHEEELERIRKYDEARKKKKEDEFRIRRSKGQDVEEDVQKWEEEGE